MDKKLIRIDIKHIVEITANKKFAKALAMAVLVKKKVRSSAIIGFTIKKLCEITNCDYRTVVKYLATLREYNLVREYNINGRTDLIFTSIRSKHSANNIYIEDFGINTLLDADYHLYMLCFKNLIWKKTWVRRQLFILHNHYKKETGKKVRHICRKYGLNRYENDEYKDFGLSLKAIAKLLGIGKEKAIKVINMSIQHGIIIKWKKFEKEHIEGIYKIYKYMDKEDKKRFTFVTKDDYIVKIHANRYYLCKTTEAPGEQDEQNCSGSGENKLFYAEKYGLNAKKSA